MKYNLYDVPSGTQVSTLNNHVSTTHGHLALADFLNGCLLLKDEGMMCVHTNPVGVDEGGKNYLVYCVEEKTFIEISGEDWGMGEKGWIYLVSA